MGDYQESQQRALSSHPAFNAESQRARESNSGMLMPYTSENVGTFRVRIEAGMYSADELRALAVLADEQREKVRESLRNSLSIGEVWMDGTSASPPKATVLSAEVSQ